MNYSCSQLTYADLYRVFSNFCSQSYLTVEGHNTLMLALGHEKLASWMTEIRDSFLKKNINLPKESEHYSILEHDSYRILFQDPRILNYHIFERTFLSIIESSEITQEHLLFLKKAHDHPEIKSWVESFLLLLLKNELSFSEELKKSSIFSMHYYSFLIMGKSLLHRYEQKDPEKELCSEDSIPSYVRTLDLLKDNIAEKGFFYKEEVERFIQEIHFYFNENKYCDSIKEFIAQTLAVVFEQEPLFFIEQSKIFRIDLFLELMSLKKALLLAEKPLTSSSALINAQAMFLASTFIQKVECPEENIIKYRFHPFICEYLEGLLKEKFGISEKHSIPNIDVIRKLGLAVLDKLNNSGISSLIVLGLNSLFEKNPFIHDASIPESLFCVDDPELMFQFDAFEDSAYCPKEKDLLLLFIYEMTYHFIRERKQHVPLSFKSKTSIPSSILINLQDAYLDEIRNNKIPWIPSPILEHLSADQRDLLIGMILSLPGHERAVQYGKYTYLLKLHSSQKSKDSFKILARSWPECIHAAIHFEESNEDILNKLDLLLSAGIPINKRDHTGRSIFHHCIDLNKEDLFIFLARDFKILFEKNGKLCSILHYLSQQEHISYKIGNFLIEKFPHLITLIDAHGKSVFYHLCLNNKTKNTSSKEAIYLLIEKIINHLKFELSEEPFQQIYDHIYDKKNIPSKVKLLFSTMILEKNTLSDQQIFLMSIKLLPYHQEIYKDLFEFINKLNRSSLIKSYLWNHVLSSKNLEEIVFLSKCLQFKDVISKQSGETFLFNAIRNKNIDLSLLLIDLGSNPNHANTLKETPLMLACEHNLPIIVDKLLKHGANPALEDVNRATALARCKTHSLITLVMSNYPCPRHSNFLLSTFNAEKKVSSSGHLHRQIPF